MRETDRDMGGTSGTHAQDTSGGQVACEHREQVAPEGGVPERHHVGEVPPLDLVAKHHLETNGRGYQEQLG